MYKDVATIPSVSGRRTASIRMRPGSLQGLQLTLTRARTLYPEATENLLRLGEGMREKVKQNENAPTHIVRKLGPHDRNMIELANSPQFRPAFEMELGGMVINFCESQKTLTIAMNSHVFPGDACCENCKKRTQRLPMAA